MKADLEKKQKANQDHSQEIRLLQYDDKYLEKGKRNRMNFVRENEILYIFPSGQQQNEQPGASSDERKD